jgi:MoaA/NifB/PqqE/SkfB family radical SAM enzyme
MIARDLATLALTHAGAAVNRMWTLPIAVVYPTGRCNSRCLSCAWWQTPGDDEMTIAEFRALGVALRSLGTRLVVVSGGEPLLRDDIWEIVESFRAQGLVLHLLTSGLALRRDAALVARHFTRVIVSLDAPTPEAYRAIRGVDGLGAVTAGVAAVQAQDHRVRVTARATLHRANFRDLTAIADAARTIGVEQVSFLAADLSSSAFGPRQESAMGTLGLTSEDVREFRDVVERCIDDRAELFARRFIAESPARLRRLPEYYAARLGEVPYPGNSCNAPSVSVVVEANGQVRPCFFHAPVGSIRDRPLKEIVNGELAAFRAAWHPSSNQVCERCVCALTLGWGAPPWS